MRSVLPAVVLVLALFAVALSQDAASAPASAPKAATGVPAVAMLKYVEIKDVSHPVVAMCSTMTAGYAQRPGDVTGPDGEGSFTYFRVPLGDRQLNLAVDSSGGVIYADANFAGSLKGEKPHRGSPYTESSGTSPFNETMTAFGPIELHVGSLGVKVKVVELAEGVIEVFPAGFMAGSITLDGHTYDVGLVDGDFNGRYDDRFDPSKKGDIFIFDANGNGKIDQTSQSHKEMQPLPSRFFVGKSCYDVEASADGASLKMTKATAKMGAVEVACPGLEMQVWSESGFHFLGPTRSKWRLPAGRYAAFEIGIVRKDSTGVPWMIQANPGVGQAGTFVVEEGRTTALKMGTPLTVKAEAVVSQRQGSVGMVLVGQGGEEYSPAITRGDSAVPAPKVTILDESGKTLSAGVFEFG